MSPVLRKATTALVNAVLREAPTLEKQGDNMQEAVFVDILVEIASAYGAVRGLDDAVKLLDFARERCASAVAAMDRAKKAAAR